MTISNRHGLPQVLVNLAMRDSYSRGAARISVTELIGSPRIRILKHRHSGEIVSDVSDMLWSLVGRALHKVVEDGADGEHIAEERLFADVNGWKISGGIDLQSPKRGKNDEIVSSDLVDWKLTSVWSVMNPKRDWERQLNSYAYLVQQAKGWDVTGLSIIAVLRDWNRREASRRPEYPQAPVQVIEQPLWSEAQREEYVRNRVLIHQDADRRQQWGEDLPDCSAEDRWMRPTMWAVMKEGRKSALRVFDSETDARAYSLAQAGSFVQERPGENVRCENHCPVSEWCGQFARIKGEASA